MNVDVSEAEREAARLLVALSPVSVDDVEAVVEGRAFGAQVEKPLVEWVRLRYDLDGTRLDP